MSRRFNNLDAALKYLRPANATPDALTPDAPAGTPLRNYQEYKAGQRVTTRDGSTQGRLDIVAIKPFALGATGENYQVPFAVNAGAALTTLGLTAVILGHQADLTDSLKVRGFRPAKAVVGNFTGAATTPESQITGKRYRRIPGGSRVFPFGASTANPNYAAAKSAVTAAAIAVDTRTVSFIPEKF